MLRMKVFVTGLLGSADASNNKVYSTIAELFQDGGVSIVSIKTAFGRIQKNAYFDCDQEVLRKIGCKLKELGF